MLIAEEMDIPVSDVTVDLADARPELLFNQQTQGSASVISIYTPVRVAAALARGRLIEAAATILGDEAENLRTTAGRVISTTGSNIPFAELATAAANEVTREAVAELKPTDEFSVIGTEQRRDDVVAAVTGRKKYTMDLDVPEALPTMIARSADDQGDRRVDRQPRRGPLDARRHRRRRDLHRRRAGTGDDVLGGGRPRADLRAVHRRGQRPRHHVGQGQRRR
jgi:isoquinoline 1-oxidoreductase subunit beta